MAEHRQLLSEALRPQCLGDLTIPKRDIDRLQAMLDSGNIMNMTFCGDPGTGKTSAARIFASQKWITAFEINGSAANGIGYVRDRITPFATSPSVYLDELKLCVIDEADGLSIPAQMASRVLIEQTHDVCRYLFTVNDRRKLIPAIRSRMMEICFDVYPDDVPEVLARLHARCEKVLTERRVQFDAHRLNQIITFHFPDLREIANRLQFEFLVGREAQKTPVGEICR